MGNSRFIKWIERNIFPAAIITLFLTLTVALVIFFTINSQVQANCNTAINVAQTRMDEVHAASHIQVDSIKAIKEATTLEIKNLLRDMEALKESIFDNNTITFLVSFVLVFLGSIWLSVERKADKLIKNAEKTMIRLEVERNTMYLHSQILALQVVSMNYQNALSMNGSIMFLNYRTYRMAEDILKEFHEDKYRYITKEGKGTFNKIITNIINDFGMDEEKFEVLPNNSVKRKFKLSINTTINLLKDLQREISRLREV